MAACNIHNRLAADRGEEGGGGEVHDSLVNVLAGEVASEFLSSSSGDQLLEFCGD
jgi:hypothetical protein